MMGTKLNAQVTIRYLQNMHAKSPPPTGAQRRMELEHQDWAHLHCRPYDKPPPPPPRRRPARRLEGWRIWWSLGTDKDPPVDSTLFDSRY